MTHVKNLGDVEAPDAPPILTVAELIQLGHARTISTSKSGTHMQIDPEGHRLLGQNQRERAERNRAWRASTSAPSATRT